MDSLRVQSFMPEADTVVQSVQFDPDKWVLKKSNQIAVSVEGPSSNKIDEYELFQNYPNPFNGFTSINYQIPETVAVTLEVYNLLGERVWTHSPGKKPWGTHTIRWEARNDRGDEMPSGVYIYRLKSDDVQISRKMILLR